MRREERGLLIAFGLCFAFAGAVVSRLMMGDAPLPEFVEAISFLFFGGGLTVYALAEDQ